MRVLVTGANGYLANFLIKSLSSEKLELVALTRNALSSDKAKPFKACYTDIDKLIISEKSFDLIYHLASYIPYGHMDRISSELIESNVLLTAKLAMSYPNSKFVLSSSVSVYGQPLEQVISLSSPFNNPNRYGLSKIAAEAIVMNIEKFSIVRFSSIIGPGMKEVSFVPKIVNLAKNTKEIVLLGNGSRLQNYIDVRDAVRMLISEAHNSKSQIILGTSNESYSNLQVATLVSELVDSRIILQGEDNSPSYVYKNSNEFNYEYDLKRSLKDMVSHA